MFPTGLVFPVFVDTFGNSWKRAWEPICTKKMVFWQKLDRSLWCVGTSTWPCRQKLHFFNILSTLLHISRFFFNFFCKKFGFFNKFTASNFSIFHDVILRFTVKKIKKNLFTDCLVLFFSIFIFVLSTKNSNSMSTLHRRRQLHFL